MNPTPENTSENASPQYLPQTPMFPTGQPQMPQSGQPQPPQTYLPQTGQPYSPPTYPPQPYSSPIGQYASQSEPASGKKGVAITALVTGIVGVVFSLFFGPFGFIAGTTGIVFGSIGLAQSSKGANRGMAIAGLVTGIVAVLFSLLSFVIFSKS